MNKKILSAAVAMALAAGISGTALAAEGSLWQTYQRITGPIRL